MKLTEKERLLTSGEIISLAKLFVSEGVTKIRLTGGEPMVRSDLNEIISKYMILHRIFNICLLLLKNDVNYYQTAYTIFLKYKKLVLRTFHCWKW